MTKLQAIANAQREASKSGKTHCVLNLNPFGALYVVREWNGPQPCGYDPVAIIDPFGNVAQSS